MDPCTQDGNLVPGFSRHEACSVANILRGVLGTRVNPDTCGRATFDLNPNTCGLEIFESEYVWTENFLIRIRVDWKFMNPDTCGLEIYESGYVWTGNFESGYV